MARQTEAATDGRFVRLLEAVEDAVQSLGRDADAVVADLDGHVVAVVPRADRDGATFGRELDGVLEEIGEDLPQPRGIAVHAAP